MITRSIALVGLMTILALAVGCGKKSTADADAPKGGICDYGTEGHCEEYKGSTFGLEEGLCKASGGGYAKDKACAKDKLLGTCISEGGNKELFYGDNTLNLLAADGKSKCENGMSKGKWADGPAASDFKTIKLADPSKIKDSCEHKAEDNGCTEFVTADVMDLQKGACDATKGKWATTTCSRENLVGSCAQSGGRIEHFYAGGDSPVDPDSQKKQCETEVFGSRGHWIAGSAAATKPATNPATSASGAHPAGRLVLPGHAPGQAPVHVAPKH